MILVTGALGSVGRALVPRLDELGHEVVGFDLAGMDVRDTFRVMEVMAEFKPDVIFHLAGAKHAPEGEVDPWHVLEVNARGTHNILTYANRAKVILASTCKACDPETAYGASKLIAERMVLNAGGTVVRFYNIPESDGNVFRLWEELPLDAPIPYTNCQRYFSPMDKCVDLLVDAIELPTGRYAPDPGHSWHMRQMAASKYPHRALVEVPRRRGDRRKEPMYASAETVRVGNGRLTITNPHDPQPVGALEGLPPAA